MTCEWLRDADTGLRYLCLDYRGLRPADRLVALAESVRVVLAEPPGVAMLIHLDVDTLTGDLITAVKHANHDVFGPLGTQKVYVGAGGIRRRIVHGMTLAAPSVHGLTAATHDQAIAILVRLTRGHTQDRPPAAPIATVDLRRGRRA